MQKFKIAEIILPKDDKGPTILKDEAGTTISGFDTKLKDLTRGTEIEVEIVVKGKYNNIKEWTLVSLAPGPTAPSPAADLATIKAMIAAYQRTMALAQACTLAAAGKIELDQVNDYAARFYTSLSGQRGSTSTRPPPITSTAETPEQLWEDMAGGTPRDPESIKNLGNLFTACKQDFNMSPSEVIKELGYSRKEEITGPIPECYRIIAEPRRE